MAESSLNKFQDLLRTLFQFDCADLDFGIYRILNYKRSQVEGFVTERLPKIVDQAFAQYAAADKAGVEQELDQTRQEIVNKLGEQAIDESGQLRNYHKTRLGQQYLLLLEKRAGYQVAEELKARVYNDLYTFFSRYYEDGDFISKRRYGRHQTYAIPYNGEEVVLYWANRDQYYVKTGDRFKAYRFKVGDYTVTLELRNLAPEQNGNGGKKRYFVLAHEAPITWNEHEKALAIAFEYRPLADAEEKKHGKTEQQKPQDSLNEAAEQAIFNLVSNHQLKAVLARTERRNDREKSILRWRLDHFTRKNTTDFFIHKDLRGFLRRELDFFIKNEVLLLDELIGGGEENLRKHIQRGRVVRQIAEAIIEFLAQVEDFQKKLWEKKKFVVRTEYCLTLDRVPEELWDEVLANEAQVAEWRQLYALDELLQGEGLFNTGLNKDFLKAHPTLVVDTRHFSEDPSTGSGQSFKGCLLAHFDDLDEALDGLLIKSENWQALNLLLEKYREKVKCIYIDPPYNTGNDGFIYKDSYQHSSWLSMISDRLLLGSSFLADDGLLLTSIDDNEAHNLMALQRLLYGDERMLSTITWEKRTKAQNTETARRMLQSKVEYIQAFRTKTGQQQFMLESTERKVYPLRDEHGPYRLQEVGQMAAGGIRGRRTMVYPIRGIMPRDGMQWKVGQEEVSRLDVAGRLTMDGERPMIVVRPDEEDKSRYSPFWSHFFDKDSYGTAESGSDEVRSDLGFGRVIETVKPTKLITKLIFHTTHASDDLVLDYFAGSGTTAHAVLNLNRQDGGRRKYILVEIGDWFETVMLPRLKKVVFCEKWKNGKPAGGDGVSHMLKYHYLEQYEDTLNNLELPREAEGQKALEMFCDEYLLKYMLDFETQGSPCLLNLEMFKDPFANKLKVLEGDEIVERPVDLVETFNYLLGVQVRKMRAFEHNGRTYRAVLGEENNGKQVAIIWRSVVGLEDNEEALMQDKAYIEQTVLPTLLGGAEPNRLLVNGACFVKDAEVIEPEFQRLMFAPVGA